MQFRSIAQGVAVCLLTAVLCACGSTKAGTAQSNTSASPITSVAVQGQVRPMAALISTENTVVYIDVEFARNASEWAKGLSNRTSLANGHGMLFIFPDQAERTFWMKDTLIPLDILFFDGSGKFVSASSMVPCTADPCPLTPSNGAARFALEVPAGFLTNYPAHAGWRLTMRSQGK